MNHIERIEEALKHAKEKHPFFAHQALYPWAPSEAKERLERRRKHLQLTIKIKHCTGCDIVDCEHAEAVEAYSRNDYKHCLEELAQCAAVYIRIMEAVEEEMKKQ